MARVIALAAMTADGRIAGHASDSVEWTSREDRRMFVRVTRRAGVVVMGRATYDTLPGPLAGRLVVVLTRHPEHHTTRPGEVEFTSAMPAEVVADLAGRGFGEIVVAGGAEVYTAFLETGQVDELWLTIEPLLFGAGLPLVHRAPPGLRLRLAEVVRLGENTVQLHYRVGAAD